MIGKPICSSNNRLKLVNMNIIKRIIILSAIVLAVSCNKEIETGYRADGNYITVRTEVATKAGYDNSQLPSSFIMDIIQVDGNSQYNYKNVKMVQVNNSNTYKAQGADGKDIELQWANVDHNAVFVTAVALPSEPETVGDNISISISNNQKNDATNFDILAAKTGNGVVIDGDDIVINFNHLMSKFYVSYEKGTGVSSFQVNSITLNNACLSGTYDYSDRYDGTDGLTSATNRSDLTLSQDENSPTAEGIFFPYTPQNAQVSITVNAMIENRSATNYSATINLKKTSGFVSGKRYVVKLKINKNGVTPVDMSSDKEWIQNISQEKILWVGTSIPFVGQIGSAGNGQPTEDLSYPGKIQQYINKQGYSNFKIINSSVPSSYVNFDARSVEGMANINAWWTNFANAQAYLTLSASLSATREEIEAKYSAKVQQLIDEEYTASAKEGRPNLALGVTTPAVVDLIHNSYSYSGLILPHINGDPTREQCSVVVMDYGYNDLPYIAMEANGWGPNETPVGFSWMSGLASGSQYIDRFSFGKMSYLKAMSYVIDECYKVNPNIKIIIGNYFATRTPAVNDLCPGTGGAACCDLLILANQAIAKKYNLDIVNVYEYTGLDDENNDSAFKSFLYDGVHPSFTGENPATETIANAYLSEFRSIFSNDTQTKSISSSKDCTWKDVELF